MRRLLIAAFACITASGSGAALSAAPGSTASVYYQVTPELEGGRKVLVIGDGIFAVDRLNVRPEITDQTRCDVVLCREWV